VDFPRPKNVESSFDWTEDLAEVLYNIAKAIQVRAAGIVAAATVALLDLGGEILPANASSTGADALKELGVGYTGGCIVHFQDYLIDCQSFIDEIMEHRVGVDGSRPPRVVLDACHDGGVTGAGILVAAALASENADR
jgi:hypothetical protein